jgi:hypothetical protein
MGAHAFSLEMGFAERDVVYDEKYLKENLRCRTSPEISIHLRALRRMLHHVLHCKRSYRWLNSKSRTLFHTSRREGSLRERIQ